MPAAGAGAARPSAPALALPLVELAEEAEAASVREVSAVGHALQSVAQVARLPQFTHLRSLVLHGGPLRSLEGLQACAGCLEELNLSGNELLVIAGLGNLPKLKALNVVRPRGKGGCTQRTRGAAFVGRASSSSVAHRRVEC